MNNIGVVVIGRNEGERLKVCLRSLLPLNLHIVYVDSASTDDSVAYVKAQGCDVVELDMSVPFSAARARNEGYQFLLNKYEGVDYIQFVDGDCEICRGWIEAAFKHLQSHPELASVCGRRKERFPEKTIYNRLCDIEWNTPVGLALATGGDFMCRKQALIDVSGFSPEVIAGEEPEMGFRMRQLGWKIERLDLTMTLHDADMTRFGQWWKRNERSGHAYAQGYHLHGNSAERYYRNDVLRILLWTVVIPTLWMVFSVVFGALSTGLLLIYPAKIGQITLAKLRSYGFFVALAYATSLILGKFPQLQGMVGFTYKRLLGKAFHIIEYKR